MKIEHFAINVEKPLEMANWYVEHLEMKIVKQNTEPPYTTFLTDDSGRIMIEIYKNPVERLLKEGAKEISNEVLENSSHLVMLKDPWGISLQLCKRAKPMLLDNKI